MRKLMWACALLMGLSLAGGSASAQSIAGYAGTPTNAFSQSASSSPGIGLVTYLRNAFDLTKVFAPFTMINKVQTPGPSVIPDPNSPAYLQAFGYRKLY
jgi:hypothetical protein